MDPRSPYFHQTRYASQHPHPQPHLHNHFHSNPNIYANAPHHSSLPAAPPLPLRPPPPPSPVSAQFHLVPTQQSQFNPQNSHLPYNPNNLNYNNHPRSQPDVPNFPHSPRILHQKPYDDDLFRRLPDNVRERQPSRLLSDRWPPERNHSSANLNSDTYRRQLGNRPISPVKIRHGLDGNSRFLEEHKIGMEIRQKEEILLRRSDDNYHRRTQFGSNQMNHGSGYDNLRGLVYDDEASENQRRGRDREVSRDVDDSFIDRGSHEIGANERIQIVTGKREHYRGREADGELERHTGKGSREGSFEYNRTPRKQPQKKSALLRIQKPNYRNREEERVHYYFDDSKSSSLRGKDQNLYPDRGMGQQVREGSPVELDVSFKSNALVAKAIVTSSPSFVAVSDSDSTPRNGKIRKVSVLNKDSLSSSPIKPSEQIVKVDNAISVANKTSSSDKGLKQAKEEVRPSGIGNPQEISSLPGSSGTRVSLGESQIESSKGTVSNDGGTNAVSDKTSSLKVAKKKKIVKRVVKKVVNPNLSSSSSQHKKKCDEPVVPVSLAHGLPTSSKAKKDDATASVSIVDSQPCSKDISVMPENNKVEGFAMTSKIGTNAGAGSGRLCAPNTKRKRSCSTSAMGSSSHEEIRMNENMINVSSANNMPAIINTDKDSKSPKKGFGSDTNHVEHIDKQQCKHEDSLLLENSKASESPKALLPPDGNATVGFLGLEKTRTNEGPSSSCNRVLGYDSDNDSINSRERVTVSDNGATDIGCKQLCIDRGSPLVENVSLDEIASQIYCVGNGKMAWQSNSAETAIQNIASGAICSNEGVRARTVSGSDSGHTVSGDVNSSSHGTSIGKQPSPECASISIENVYVGGSEEDTSDVKKSDKKVETPQLNFSKSEVNDSYSEPVNAMRSDCWVDTTLRLSFKDSSLTGVTVSGDGSADAGMQTCRDGGPIFLQGTAMDVSNAKVLSPEQKKRKLSGSQLKLSCAIISDVNEGSGTPDISASSAEAPSNSCCGLSQPKVEAIVDALDPLCKSNFPPVEKDITESPANFSEGGCHGTAASFRNSFDDDDDMRIVHLCSTVEELTVPNVQPLYQSGLEGGQIADEPTVLAGYSSQVISTHVEKVEGERMGVDSAEEQVIIASGTAQCQLPSENQSLNSVESSPTMDVENESCHHVNNDLSGVSNYLSSPRDGNGVSTTNSSGDVLGLVPDALSDMDNPETLPDIPSTSDSQLSIVNVAGDDETLREPALQGGSNTYPASSGPLDTEHTLNSEHAAGNAHSFSEKTGTLPPLDSKDSTQTVSAMSAEIYGRKIQPSQAVSRFNSGRTSFAFTNSKKAASSANISKPRTWHRTDNSSASAMSGNKIVSTTVPTQRQLPKNITKLQSTSYIRKGNSLVRKPAVVSAQSEGPHSSSSSLCRLNSLGTDEVKTNNGLENRTVVAEPPNLGRMSMSASFEGPRTPPLTTATETPNHPTSFSGDCMASSSAEPLNNCAAETSSDPVTCAESNGVLQSSEDAMRVSENPMLENGQVNSLDCHSELNDGNVFNSNASSITYVKRKSNQLVATSNPHSLSIKRACYTPPTSSDAYYKRRKNQLVRTSQESQVKLTGSMPDGCVHSDEQTLDNNTSSRSLTKRRLCKVMTKMPKPSKLSLVWTLRSAKSNGDGELLHCQKVLPHLFPWKRATYWKNFMPNSAANLIGSAASTIRKLLLLRKRDTVYTRSKHGFSLRKSKVLSVGGSSLKWSKSIERQSKKANEEATLAVAEAQRKKREESSASSVVSGLKCRNYSSLKSVRNIKLHPGERIFRIGSVHYKMDSSRRTLQRISDDESSYPAAPQTEKNAKRSYVPRRLVIGKDEYVRIGNGNQLVRDPKKRTRILASEKVRWSLHTARLRLARKRKYCQFFTRFGKCNKDDGKCPYIHDSSKIAVCTKFLNGFCFNSDCKLTHKVIPERMPDCSYFLQGICNNKNCPYRHVHVNPDASTCEGFLRGYCADGNECRKKHSYVCPTYEATGSCPQGSKCKLHHPKNRSKGKKNKQSREKKNAQGRYFGSMHINHSEPRVAVSEKHLMQDTSNICFEGRITDYISLDFSDEAEENSNPAYEQRVSSLSDPMESVDLDELIKPIRIMNT